MSDLSITRLGTTTRTMALLLVYYRNDLKLSRQRTFSHTFSLSEMSTKDQRFSGLVWSYRQVITELVTEFRLLILPVWNPPNSGTLAQWLPSLKMAIKEGSESEH